MHIRSLVPAVSLALLLPALSKPAAAEPATYEVNGPHSSVSFTIRHILSDVDGRFKTFNGTIKYDKANPAASSVQFTIQAASINTDNDDRDKHLRSGDFFDVEKFQTLSFTSTSVAAKDPKTLNVTGDLVIHGVTKKVTVPVTVQGTMNAPGMGEVAGFKTSFTIDRKDYGMGWNRANMLGDDVTINIKVEAHAPQPAGAKK